MIGWGVGKQVYAIRHLDEAYAGFSQVHFVVPVGGVVATVVGTPIELYVCGSLDVQGDFGLEGMGSRQPVLDTPLVSEIGLDIHHVLVRKRRGVYQQFGQVAVPCAIG